MTFKIKIEPQFSPWFIFTTNEKKNYNEMGFLNLFQFGCCVLKKRSLIKLKKS